MGETAGRDDRITLRFMTTPADTAAGGRSVAAGSVMEWIDKAGYACAVGWSGAYCVTAYVGNVRHTRPIPPGSLVEVQARIIHTGRSSMHVAVTVCSADVSDHRYSPATACVLIFVAKDADGAKATVPVWEPLTASDRQLARIALERIELRTEIKTRMLAEEFTEATAAPRTTLRFLVPPSVVNWGGKAHGGTVMRWIDEAGYACATAWLGQGPEPAAADSAIAVYSGGIHFLNPVRIGDLVELEARVLHTTERSMHLSVLVWSADPRHPRERSLTTLCQTIFVAAGDHGALPVPQWDPELPEDRRHAEHVTELIELRKQIAPLPVDLTLRA
ncbi:acyl-CoA thioesterase [Naumannella halotolerans]|uniref:4-hydroxybenzoyl-CoA thioesterase n=1 Tax=Naumannella halotolerans TaxID=993414 RepID=A0A4V3END2_9ACTN|nr:acyl-CoA thioesterase [Naumannella halotolerans]TDT33338.1 4-hydroxybenzoyl-CoA thioesterase [Naumannella halotolerans]